MPDTSPAANTATAVLLIAHGSRRADANQDLVRLRDLVRQRRRYPVVEISYLELAEPTIDQGAARCVARGAQQVLMLPWFLAAGAHVVEDLEEHRRTAAAAHPGVDFVLCPPLGLHPLLVEVVLARLDEGQASLEHDRAS